MRQKQLIARRPSTYARPHYKSVKAALDLKFGHAIPVISSKRSACITCKGARMLCGKSRCPLLTKITSYLRIKPLFNQEQVNGSSPPGVFVGRIGYPYVYAGPLVPPFHGNTQELDAPERWFGKTMEEIVDFRLKLVRGKFRVHVKKPQRNERFVEDTRFLAMAENAIDVELELTKRPQKRFVLNDNVQPMGPSAVIKNMRAGNGRLNAKIEKAYYDDDLKAVDAVQDLYNRGVAVSRLQKALSVGAFGRKTQRKLVPTRWSITAVDSMISQKLMDKVREFPRINEVRIYESNYLDNRFEVLMFPDAWKYEAMEAWYPGTVWNPQGEPIYLVSDWEGHRGRTYYATMGGCYYAARLAVNEKLLKERRQATAIVLREAHPDYIMPVGVWQVRENVRHALKKTALTFDQLKPALNHLKKKFDIPLKIWVDNSKILKDTLVQTKLSKYW
jgi:hypothetical protein